MVMDVLQIVKINLYDAEMEFSVLGNNVKRLVIYEVDVQVLVKFVFLLLVSVS